MPNFAIYAKSPTDTVQSGAAWVSQSAYVTAQGSPWAMTDDVDNEPVITTVAGTAPTPPTFRGADMISYAGQVVEYSSVPPTNPWK